MKKIKTAFTLCMALVGSIALGASSLEEVIAKHVQARGGLDGWNQVRTMTITGTYTGFSEPASFTLHRKKPNLLFFDHILGKRPITIGFDGVEPWWINTWYGIDWAIPIGPVDANVVIQETDFATPFFDYQKAGHSVEFLGKGDFDGQEALKLKLVRKSGGEEIWYLDPETYLEIGRSSKGSDFGQELEQTTFYSDFQRVSGLMMPFVVEHEFGIRHRIMEIGEIKFNTEVDESLFRMPMPKGMDKIEAVLGDWDVEIHGRRGPSSEMRLQQKTSASIRALAHGSLFQEVMSTNQGIPIEVMRTWTFDRYQDTYRITMFNDFHKVLQIFEGGLSDGVLTIDNLKTNTAFEERGKLFHDRFTFSDIGSDNWTVQRERSEDKGETWFTDMKVVYSRPSQTEK